MKKLNVLIGCEYSGVVRDAFAKLGHNAWSCDLLPTDRPNPKHIQGDIFNILDQDWDLAIFHPPCTFLTVSNAQRWEELQRTGKQQAAIKFVEALYDCKIPHICIENPVGAISTRSKLGKPSQYIQPYEYGHYEQKKTGLWLRGLNPLVPTDIKDLTGLPKKVTQRLHYLPPSPDRWKIRSQTYQGIANAMAAQFSKQLEGI
mgnify:CR=1 FL=1|tara:strand:- start:225 stop:830 length:606 start_codon:yes stop_codon:yes gene_type:complete